MYAAFPKWWHGTACLGKIVVLFFFFTQSWFPPTPTHTIPKEDRVNISGKKQSVKPQKASQI